VSLVLQLDALGESSRDEGKMRVASPSPAVIATDWDQILSSTFLEEVDIHSFCAFPDLTLVPTEQMFTSNRCPAENYYDL